MGLKQAVVWEREMVQKPITLFFQDPGEEKPGWNHWLLIAAAVVGDVSPILKFPSSLLSLDLPDIWPPSSPAVTNCCTANDQPSAALVIDGKLIADEIRFRIAEQVRRMKDSVGKVPGLAVILVGDRRDSLTYVRNKVIACEDAGIKSLVTQFPQNCNQDDVIRALSTFNEDPSIHGILVQLPLPQHLNEEKDFECAQVRKGCRWLPSTQHGEPCNERKGTVVHPMHSKGLY
ncbi:C-1-TETRAHYDROFOLATE SYNTHASE CYTOPLASMIC-RELATED [Salix viminalis]|uniref:methenyltetrahydrofolate cyclohydrolase n=1 Tax=Salix viminalis TaxID=40686 RepID=A0A9Q0V5D4_SALVM|nr:C-1-TETRAHYDROFOLATE SYNTHASE CYTOPLASMIC-RELATED [Salix viminalis]